MWILLSLLAKSHSSTSSTFILSSGRRFERLSVTTSILSSWYAAKTRFIHFFIFDLLSKGGRSRNLREHDRHSGGYSRVESRGHSLSKIEIIQLVTPPSLSEKCPSQKRAHFYFFHGIPGTSTESESGDGKLPQSIAREPSGPASSSLRIDSVPIDFASSN